MKLILLHIFIVVSFCSRAQSPFMTVRANINSENYETSQRILDSCSFAKYHQDSVFFYKGMLVLRKGNLKGARIQCLLLQSSYPEFYEAHYLSALIYFTAQDYGNSISQFGFVLKVNPRHLNSLFNRSIAYGLLDDYTSAIEDLSSCISINPDYGMAYYSRAYWYEFTSKFAEAKKDYEQSIRLDPKNYDAYFGLAYIYQNEKQNAKACETIADAIQAGSQIATEIKENFCR